MLGEPKLTSPINRSIDETARIPAHVTRSASRPEPAGPWFELAGPRAKLFFEPKNTRAGIYRMKNIESGIQFLNEGDIIPESILSEFEIQLKKLVNEIFDRNVLFDQTDDIKKCANCPYNTICNRF